MKWEVGIVRRREGKREGEGREDKEGEGKE